MSLKIDLIQEKRELVKQKIDKQKSFKLSMERKNNRKYRLKYKRFLEKGFCEIVVLEEDERKRGQGRRNV